MRTSKELYTFIILCCGSLCAYSQSDTSHTLKSVEVKAVHLETLSSRAAMPVTVISRKTLEMMGSRRLDEVMREQTGIAIVNDVSAGSRAIGMQLQGFSADYILILIDGQPMIGRNAGNFDLSRITVADIERIEIVKGASSSLFGSEALGGVVNIITRQRIDAAQGQAIVRCGSQNTQDFTLEGETPFGRRRNRIEKDNVAERTNSRTGYAGNTDSRGSLNLSGNFYHTDGYNVNSFLSKGTTAPPYDSYSLQGRMRYQLNEKNSLHIAGRWALRNSINESVYSSGQVANTTRDVLHESDVNSAIVWQANLNKGWQLKTQYYLTRYSTTQDVSTGKAIQLSSNDFTQYYHRFEEQVQYVASNQLSFAGGVGGNLEVMDGNDLKSGYAYLQGDWKVNSRLSSRLGFRYDHSDFYGGRLNPSAGLKYRLSEKISLTAAFGTGYKTPDFQKRYQVFTNPQAGYTVLGVEEVATQVAAMQAAGLISEVRPVAKDISAALKPEIAVSYNMGISYTPVKNIRIDVNGFYNQLHNFINTVQIATRTNFQPIYSYINLDRSFTGGVETGISMHVMKGLDVAAGYQLLYAKDRGIMDAIRTGDYPYNKIRNNSTGETRTSKVSDYIGLENRSRHMLNLRMFYEYAPWGISATFRANYKSRSGYDDANNNRFLDTYDTFIDAYCLVYASIEKKLCKGHLAVQFTADNLMNYTDMLMPGQPGRILMAGLKWRLFKQ
ncbi:TonB-dependent receptor plug domain-containing protein [Chitinophaga sancti]|uniref:Outer membrane receptor for ferrienterochelin and colicins n=1 Tax=Chitinophaga sancti TaxID=1004 RepID=A0A1K1PI10_9BACT|nr:TonB-dependent receptor [Chitinophaga sancti]WQD65925.1 TonB-dependent receptor [Chitinophaga sancti]WQG88453.1 TonB-dependent receptor [Chitinophaga sancti]SFW47097.1 outer membrane receptor for ferrienterochelin and colicins [Chitinophaga sancti]